MVRTRSQSHLDERTSRITAKTKGKAVKLNNRVGTSSVEDENVKQESERENIISVSEVSTRCNSPRFLWSDSTDLASAINKSLRYSQECSESKSMCDDAVTLGQMDWLKNRWQDILSSGRMGDVLEGIRNHVLSQALPESAAARLLISLNSILEKDPRMEPQITQLVIAMIPVHREMVLDFLSSCSHVAVILSVVETVGCREGARLVARLLGLLTLKIPEIAGHLYSLPHVCAAAFTLQVLAYHISRQLPDQSLAAHHLLKCLEKFLLVRRREAGGYGLMLSEGENVIVRCPQCPDTDENVIAKIATEGLSCISKFRCRLCHNFFSLNCSTCSACPVEDCCWGCGYRLIAAEATGDDSFRSCSDERRIASVLALTAIEANDARRFTCEYFSMIDPSLSPPAIGQGGQSTQLSISSQFAVTLLHKLVVNERLEAVGLMVIRALLAVGVPTATSSKALSFAPSAWPEVKPAVTAYAWNACVDQWQSARVQTAAVALLSDSQDLLAALPIMCSLSGKKLVVKKLFSDPSDVMMVESVVLQFLMCEWEPLFELVMEGLGHYWKSQPLSPELVDHFSHIFNFLNSNIVLGDLFRRRVDPGVIVRLYSREVLLAALLAETENVEPFLPLIPELLAACDFESLANLVMKTEYRILTQQQVRTLLVDSLLPTLVRGSSGNVRSAAVLLGTLGLKKYVNIDSTISPVVERFSSELFEIRSFWILGSLVEVLGLEKELVDRLLVPECPVGALGFLAASSACGEAVMARPEFDSIMKPALGSVRGVDALVHIMESAGRTTLSEKDSKSRPDGGVRCRPLAKYFAILCESLFSENVVFATKSLQAILLMDRLGIVNRRSLGPLLLARFVLSVPCESDEEVDDDTVDLNALAWHSFKKLKDSTTGVSSILPAVLAIVNRHIRESELHVSNTAFRMSQYLFFGENCRKEDAKNAAEILISKIEKNQKNSSFLVACFLNAVSVFPDLKHMLEGRVNVDDESFCFEFLAAEMGKQARSKRPWERLETTAQIVNRFVNRTIVAKDDNVEKEVEQVRVPKRRRSSTEKPQKTPVVKKMKRKPESDDDEYTDGGDDEDDMEEPF